MRIFIREIFDANTSLKILNKRVEENDETDFFVTHYRVENNITIVLSIDGTDKKNTEMEISFYWGDKDYEYMADNGLNFMAKLFYTIKKIALSEISRYEKTFNDKVDKIYFTAVSSKKSSLNNDGAEQRANIYKYFIKKHFPSSNVKQNDFDEYEISL